MTPIEVLTPIILLLAFVGYVFCLSRIMWITLGLTAALAAYFSRGYPFDGANLFYWGAAGGVVLTAWLAAMVLRPTDSASGTPLQKKKPKRKSELPGVVIDGTNVMYWDGKADLRTLRVVVNKLRAKNLTPFVFLDASSRHHLGDKSLDQSGFAQVLGLKRNQVTVCPAQTEADAFLLKFAKDNNMPVVSNDRFGDRAALAKGLKLIKGVIVGGKPVLQGL